MSSKTQNNGAKHMMLQSFYRGKDATEEFEPIHPPDTLDKYLNKSKHLGDVDMGTVEKEEKEESPEEIERQDRIARMPILEQCYNLMDFEAVARDVMKKTAWAYYSSGADDEITMRENHSAFHKIWFRPKILVDVEKVDFTTTMLGTKVDIPFYVTATALGKLGNPEGEVVLTRAAKKHNVIQMIPTLASCSFDEIMDAAEGDQVQWMQLYVNKDREITKRIVQHAESRGCKGLFITVDAPQLGRREKDMRSKFTDVGSAVQSTGNHAQDNSQGAARAISSFIDPGLAWKDIPWFQSITKMPIILKGVQRVEDVIRAIESGVQGVVLSNHGGRQLDFARSGIEVLAEVMPVLRERGWENRIEIFVDGGIRRATDIIKALCLGAKGVGIGRPFLYAMSTYGLPGADRAMQLLKDEMEMNMRLIGCSSVDQLNPTLVDTRGLSMHTTSVPADTLGLSVYDPLVNPKAKAKAKFSISRLYYRGANACILCYSITDLASFEEMGIWLTELRRNLPADIILHVVGTKADIVTREPSKREVPFERCIAYVADNLAPGQSSTPPATATPGLGGGVGSAGTQDTGASRGVWADGARSPSSKRSSGFWGQEGGVGLLSRKKMQEQLSNAAMTPGLSSPEGSGDGGGGYFDGMRSGGSFRVGRDRRSWLGFPTEVPIVEDEDVQNSVRKKGRRKCC
ncbi:hypothetical protein B7494_g4536 [Chlorociboria aeruginascens]|nr:hypothetical protein B7494_g4536 [Chlorociboria aeruginascens]